METDTVQERTTFEASSLPEDREEIPESFPGHEALPSVCIHLSMYMNLYCKQCYKKLSILGLGTNNCSRWSTTTTPTTNARNNKRGCSNT